MKYKRKYWWTRVCQNLTLHSFKDAVKKAGHRLEENMYITDKGLVYKTYREIL